MKKTALLFISLMLVLALAIPTFANNPASVTGYSSSRVVAKDLTNVPCIRQYTEEAYADATEFKVCTAADLTFIAEEVNTYGAKFSDYVIYLANDLDLGGAAWTPIGNSTTGDVLQYFAGTFDGQGHVVDNFVVNRTEKTNLIFLGFFGAVKGATIKNLVIGNRATVTNAATGDQGDYRVGTIVGGVEKGNKTTIDNCYAMANVTNSGRYAGGIVGFNNQAELSISNCTSKGNIIATYSVGGILGNGSNNSILTVSNCRNTGNVSADTTIATNGNAAGIIGAINTKAGTVIVENCINNGTVTAPVNGPIIGTTRGNATYTGNINYGTVTNADDDVTASGVWANAYDAASETTANNQKSNNQNLADQTDPTLNTVETITPDFYTGACQQVTSSNNTSSGDNTENNMPNNEDSSAKDTTASTDTETVSETIADEDADGGCGSVVGGVSAVIVAMGAAALVTKKRKF